MRTLSQGRVARGIAQALTVAFWWSLASLASLAVVGLAAAPAGAQVPTGTMPGPVVTGRAATTQTVAVAPFDNLSRYRPDTFGQEASDAVEAELRTRLFLDVLPKAEIELWMRDLGYQAPLSQAELARLATELEINTVVTGQVRRARILQSREGRYAEVEIGVLVFDREAQTSVNGALVSGRGPASLEASDDALMTKALQQAAFEAVGEMRTRPTVTAMVLWARDTTIYMNVGGRGGLAKGMKMVAIRNGLRIGMVDVTDATPNGSYGQLIEGSPLRTGDRLRAIYELPTGAGAPSPERHERKKHRWETMVLAAAAIFGVADLGTTARTLVEGNVAAPYFTASNMANGAEWNYAYAPFLPAVLLTWIPYSGTEKTRLLIYELVRDGEWVEVLLPHEIFAENFLIDTGGFALVVETVTITIDPVTGLVTGTGRTFEEYDPENPPTDLGFTGTDVSLQWRWIPSGVSPGQPYWYRVRPWVKEQVRLADGTYTWRFASNAEFSTSPNYLTAVAPPLLAGYQIVDSLATFYFYTPVGADDAIIQVAKDPYGDFPPDKTYQKPIPGVWTNGALFDLLSFDVDLDDVALLPGSDDILWVRVGARNRYDTHPARPWPLNLSGYAGWVWSDRRQVLLTQPAATRAKLARREREALRLGAVDRHRQMNRPGRVAGERVFRTK